jgi:predicted glycosyltransferase
MDFVEDTASYVVAADLVVSMGGYNSVCELLSSDTPAIVVPRVWPRKEQLIRARALSKRGLLRMIHPSRLTPERLRDEIDGMLEAPQTARVRLPLDGLSAVTAELEALLRAPARPVLRLGG